MQDAFIRTPYDKWQYVSIKTAYDKLCWLCGENNDHPDHIAGAKIARDAMKWRYYGTAMSQFYVGDPAAGRAGNLNSAESDAKSRVAAWYGMHDSKYTCSRASSS